MFVTAIVILVVLEVASIAYAMHNATVIEDDDDFYLLSEERIKS